VYFFAKGELDLLTQFFLYVMAMAKIAYRSYHMLGERKHQNWCGDEHHDLNKMAKN
jgi:hypothetical protein